MLLSAQHLKDPVKAGTSWLVNDASLSSRMQTAKNTQKKNKRNMWVEAVLLKSLSPQPSRNKVSIAPWVAFSTRVEADERRHSCVMPTMHIPYDSNSCDASEAATAFRCQEDGHRGITESWLTPQHDTHSGNFRRPLDISRDIMIKYCNFSSIICRLCNNDFFM